MQSVSNDIFRIFFNCFTGTEAAIFVSPPGDHPPHVKPLEESLEDLDAHFRQIAVRGYLEKDLAGIEEEILDHFIAVRMGVSQTY